MPAAVGTLALAAAATGALTIPHPTDVAVASEVAVGRVPGLPDPGATGSSDAVVAGADRTSDPEDSAAETAEDARGLALDRVVASAAGAPSAERQVAADVRTGRVDAVVEQRRAAAERAARAKRRSERRAERRAVALARATVLPVRHVHLTAGFGSSGGMWSHRHTGLDFANPVGTPVMAVAGGTVVEAGWAGAYGDRLIIRHADGTETWYCHLSAILHTGGQVSAGEVVARVGATGNVTGSHLHLEVHPGGGDPVDPLGWLRSRGVRI